MSRVSRAPEIVRMAREGKLSLRQIAEVVGTHISYVKAVLHDARANGTLSAGERDETPGQARKRVARELALGVRCRRCHLLLPCDHVN